MRGFMAPPPEWSQGIEDAFDLLDLFKIRRIELEEALVLLARTRPVAARAQEIADESVRLGQLVLEPGGAARLLERALGIVVPQPLGRAELALGEAAARNSSLWATGSSAGRAAWPPAGRRALCAGRSRRNARSGAARSRTHSVSAVASTTTEWVAMIASRLLRLPRPSSTPPGPALVAQDLERLLGIDLSAPVPDQLLDAVVARAGGEEATQAVVLGVSGEAGRQRVVGQSMVPSPLLLRRTSNRRGVRFEDRRLAGLAVTDEVEVGTMTGVFLTSATTSSMERACSMISRTRISTGTLRRPCRRSGRR